MHLVLCRLRRRGIPKLIFLIIGCPGLKRLRTTDLSQLVLGSGTVVSGLLPIGLRAKRGPTFRLQTYIFNRKCLCRAGVERTIFLCVGSVVIENKNELHRFLTPSIIIIRFLIATMVIVFRQWVACVFQ